MREHELVLGGNPIADECEDCHHGRSMHERDQALGACNRLGCPCSAYAVILSQRKVYLDGKVGDLWVVVEERILFHQHPGWEYEGDEPATESEEGKPA